MTQTLSDRIRVAKAEVGDDRWYVTDGVQVIGPVSRRLLLRGIAAGRVPGSCGVARHAWPNWRAQSHVREVRALQKLSRPKLADNTLPFPELPNPAPKIDAALEGQPLDASSLSEAADPASLLSEALRLAVRSTAASVGVLHLPRAPHVGLVTTRAEGRGMAGNLGEVVPLGDDARRVAAGGLAITGNPSRDDWARSSARRLCHRVRDQVRGVALLPVSVFGQPGLLELGRFDHAFRSSDPSRLQRIGSAFSRRVRQLR